MTAGTAAFNATRGCAVAVIIAGLLLVSPAAAQSISDKLNSWFFGPPAQDNANPADANTPAEIDCPGVEVRHGASTLAINTPGAEAGPMTTRYQVTIGHTARPQDIPVRGVLTSLPGGAMRTRLFSLLPFHCSWRRARFRSVSLGATGSRSR